MLHREKESLSVKLTAGVDIKDKDKEYPLYVQVDSHGQLFVDTRDIVKWTSGRSHRARERERERERERMKGKRERDSSKGLLLRLLEHSYG